MAIVAPARFNCSRYRLLSIWNQDVCSRLWMGRGKEVPVSEKNVQEISALLQILFFASYRPFSAVSKFCLLLLLFWWEKSSPFVIIVQVEDRGGAIKGKARIDLYHRSHHDALKWGRQKLKVRAVTWGTWPTYQSACTVVVWKFVCWF